MSQLEIIGPEPVRVSWLRHTWLRLKTLLTLWRAVRRLDEMDRLQQKDIASRVLRARPSEWKFTEFDDGMSERIRLVEQREREARR